MTAAANHPSGISASRTGASRPTLRRLLTPALLGFAIAALAFYARRHYIEPESIAFACEPNPWQGWCAARSMLIQTFAQGGLGWAALAAGALALVTGSLLPAYIAWVCGLAGLIFYCYEFAVVGALVGALVIVRKLSQR